MAGLLIGKTPAATVIMAGRGIYRDLYHASPNGSRRRLLPHDVIEDLGHRKLDQRGVRGAPDFVVEVLSPATASHDYLLKRHAYERAGVREYWLVHPADRMRTFYRLADGGCSVHIIASDATNNGVLTRAFGGSP